MQIFPTSVLKPQNTFLNFKAKKFQRKNIQDSFEIKNPEKTYEKRLEKIADKINVDSITKEYLDDFLLKYDETNRELAKEILCLSAPNLSWGGTINSIRELFSKSNYQESFIKIDSGLEDLIGYILRKQIKNSDSGFDYFNINDFKFKKPKQHEIYAVCDGIFNRDLTNSEIKTLAKIEKLKILNLNYFEILPNFIDFAISDDKAKEKIDKLIIQIKSLKQQNPNLSDKEALNIAVNFYLKRNLEKIEKEREKYVQNWQKNEDKAFFEREKTREEMAKKVSIFDHFSMGLDIHIQKEVISNKVKCINAKSECDNYENIDNYLNLHPTCDYSVIYRYIPTKDTSKELKKITKDTLKQDFKKAFKNPQKVAQAIASDEFTYYTPKKFITALDSLIQELKINLNKKGLTLNDCIFVYHRNKSDAFIGYLLEQMGLVENKQRKELRSLKRSHKTKVFVDDILGSGLTAKKSLDTNNKNNYFLNVVSCAIGRNANNIKNMIYYQDSFNGKDSIFEEIRRCSFKYGDDRSDVARCNSCEVFFFSFSDTCNTIYEKFSREILGLKDRVEGAY